MVANQHNGLRTWRQSRGWSAKRLATRLGIDKSTLHRYELAPASSAARVPVPRIMAAIWIMSEGRIGPMEFYDLPELE